MCVRNDDLLLFSVKLSHGFPGLGSLLWQLQQRDVLIRYVWVCLSHWGPAPSYRTTNPALVCTMGLTMAM